MIAAEDVRRLLAAGPEAVLVAVAGRAEVLQPGDLESDRYRGALRVTTRAELVRQAGTEEFSERQVTEQAAALDTAVAELGG